MKQVKSMQPHLSNCKTRLTLWWQKVMQREEATPFEVWAEKLTGEKGFADLTEEDVTRIVHESRKARG